MGIELTGVPAEFKEKYFNPSPYNELYEQHSQEMDVLLLEKTDLIETELKNKNIKYYTCHHDVHCIEVSSPKLYTMQEAESWCIAVRDIFNFYDCYPKHPETVDGGAHIHLGIKDKYLKVALAKDLIMRPFLPWVFGEKDEVDSMNVLINKKTYMRDLLLEEDNLDRDVVFYSPGLFRVLLSLIYNTDPVKVKISPTCDIIGLMDWSKDYMFRSCFHLNTFEFRFFEMTPTWEEQKLQIQFLMAYVKWVKNRMHRGDVTNVALITDHELQMIRPQQAIDGFKKLCQDIRIDFAPYKVFINRNLLPRWGKNKRRV